MRSLIVLLCIAFIVEAETNPGCLKDWTYFAKSDKCYKVFGGEFDSVRPTTWALAEEYCNTKFKGGHLASFHSDDEATFITDLSQLALWDNGGAGHMHVGCSYTGNNVWEWTDGSRWTYIRWWSGRDVDENMNNQAQNSRGYLHTQRRWAGTFWFGAGDYSVAFACQMPPSSEG